MSELIERNIEALDKADLFNDCDVDSIMEDMERILAGYVIESWLTEFVEVLKKGESDGKAD